MWKFGKTRFLISITLMALSMFFQFAGPSLVLKAILDYIKEPNAPLSTGIFLVLCLFLAQLMRNLTFNMMQSIGIHTAIRLLAAVEFCGFSKLLRLTSPDEAALGQLITFTTADHERIQEAVVNSCMLVGTPVMFLISIIYSVNLVGPSALVGGLAMLLFYPTMGIVAAVAAKLRLKVVTITDKRVTMMDEIINSMRLIKMYAWEEPFIQRVEELRRQEISQLRKAALIQAFGNTVGPSATIVAGFATFVTMTLAEVELSTTQAFTILSLFNSMQFTIATLAWSLKMLTEAMVGFGRLQQLLELKDYEHPANKKDRELSSKDNRKKEEMIKLDGARMAWTQNQDKLAKAAKAKKGSPKDAKKPPTSTAESQFVFDLRVKQGELIGVAGAVGSGKTSLVSTIMGEMEVKAGEVEVGGSLALVSQQAWIFNATLRENILMGSPMNTAWYSKVLEACALTSDLKLLSHGDQTEIGERGVTLSGGQRQRVNLARALYADLDIYLLDDPLSAVDAKVGEHIFTKYVQGMLERKTVLLVTHGMHYLKRCDRVVFLKNGQIEEKGTHEELMAKKDGAYAKMATFDAKRNSKSEPAEKIQRRRTESTSSALSEIEEEKAIQKEAAETTGKDLGWTALFKFLRHCIPVPVQMVLFLAMSSFAILRLGTSIWLQVPCMDKLCGC